MNRAHLWTCFDLLMLATLLFGAVLSGCGPVYRDDYDGARERVTRSRPAQAGLSLGGVTGSVTAAQRSR